MINRVPTIISQAWLIVWFNLVSASPVPGTTVSTVVPSGPSVLHSSELFIGYLHLSAFQWPDLGSDDPASSPWKFQVNFLINWARSAYLRRGRTFPMGRGLE